MLETAGCNLLMYHYPVCNACTQIGFRPMIMIMESICRLQPFLIYQCTIYINKLYKYNLYKYINKLQNISDATISIIFSDYNYIVTISQQQNSIITLVMENNYCANLRY